MSDDITREVATMLFGDGSDELISKMTPEQQRKKYERRQAQVGLASNAVGLAAGAAGTWTARNELNSLRREAKGLPPKPIPTKGFKGKLHRIKGKHAMGLAGAGLGLQVANVGGDLVANRVLARASKEPKKESVKKSEPGSADIHIPGMGTLKRKAAKKAYDKAPTVKKGALKILDGGPDVGAKVEVHQKKVSKSVTWEGEISKVNADKRQVFGWASIVEIDGQPVVDLQGDYIDIDEIEKSAYDYVIKSRKGGEMHRRNGEEPVHVSDMIESFLVTPEKKEKLGLPDSMPTGWWVGYQINDDEAWNLVKSGKRTGFSIHGRGQRTHTEI